MEQRFIIFTDSAKGIAPGANAAERNAVTRYLEAKGWQVWHWFEDVWLLVAPEGSTTPSALRKELTTLLGELKHVLVMQADGPIRYSGMGPKDGWPWMGEKWGKPE